MSKSIYDIDDILIFIDCGFKLYGKIVGKYINNYGFLVEILDCDYPIGAKFSDYALEFITTKPDFCPINGDKYWFITKHNIVSKRIILNNLSKKLYPNALENKGYLIIC